MKPVGYTFLNRHYNLLLPKLGVEVYQDPSAESERFVDYGASKRRVLPGSRKNIDTPYENIVAAIKYQGIRLPFFAAMFKVMDIDELTAFILAKPSSKYNRVIWYLYEWLTDSKLDIPDLKHGNYIRLFDDEYYYTLDAGIRDRRTHVINNAIGTREFCPTIRKTPMIKELAEVDVYKTAYEEVQKLGEHLSVDVIGRSINYLYTKETRSSTEIEKEQPDKKKMQRFLNSIKNAGLFELSKSKLVHLQNQIVEDKAKQDDYRTCEIYIGSTIQKYGFTDEDVHYIGALAKHVPSMMNGLFETHDKLMIDANVPALMHAAVISFGEVYIHPFDDGNGRIHRYLIHDVMKQREPDHKFIIPISAAILKNVEKYDQVLESISKPIMSMLDWELDPDNAVLIHNDIDHMYRYPDYTEHVEFVYDMMNTAISKELVEEMCLIIVYDFIKKSINSVADIPNAILDKIVSIIINGGGKVSKNKTELVAKHIEVKLLVQIEESTVQLIEDLNKSLKIDVQAVMQKS
ncbi:MAG: Fic family protein [Thalassotalea sp.]|nr:Fic family protein [Thalassotalea sp.]MDG2392253.1 Fic family protein [Thalassotalea sp.]